ncbi:ketopantoate reductase family protein [Sediminicoccus sp. KRV36]|uniref:ketopantoate reductase family protein n=1 Tax=Sediminicoccus sp. KRV36 TaxID=3133721 RepID=UPI00200F62CD|nr:ketopantoate reductase family protein [Sediminicoccus rosea]UPY36531.1 ketopantoate reductase family protein [Sediminicoccus rosea]
MRVLVLGAGALGGYFGGRLAEASGDVTFLVRPARAARLAEAGLVIESPFGDARLPVKTVTAEALQPGWDVILLTCKAYDLEDAMASIEPAMDARTAILPVLNGLSHIETLQARFGAERVLGGLCKIQATLTPSGVVRQLNDWRWLTFGEMDGGMSPRVAALEAAFARARGMEAKAVPNIAQRLWEKLVHLGTSAVGTVLMRANVGEIVRAGGSAWLQEVLARNAAIAARHGHPMPESFMAEYRALFSDPASAYATSMLRDIEAGNRIEGEHILGFLAAAAARAGVESAIHDAAALHAGSYEQRRAANRLP